MRFDALRLARGLGLAVAPDSPDTVWRFRRQSPSEEELKAFLHRERRFIEAPMGDNKRES